MTIRKSMAIAVAARGWQGSEWDSFYPEGLPAEWRLDYYANEFFAVLVPYSDWSVQGDDELLAWQEQVSEEFLFYWELPSDNASATLRLQHLRTDVGFAAHWGGVVEQSVGESMGDSLSPSPLSSEVVSLLPLHKPLELRQIRKEIDALMEQGEGRILVAVDAAVADSLYPVRDLAWLLVGG